MPGAPSFITKYRCIIVLLQAIVVNELDGNEYPPGCGSENTTRYMCTHTNFGGK